MSPFRIVVSFAIAGLALYQGIAYPNSRTLWFTLAGVAFVVAIYRVIKFRSASSQSGSGSSGTDEQL